MKKSRTIAAVLAFFFGAFGVHKFYLREKGVGFAYLFILFITIRWRIPVTVILGIIDAIVLLSMDDVKFDRKYNKDIESDETFGRNPRKYSRLEIDKPKHRYRYNSQNSVKRDNPFKKSGIEKYKEYDLEGAMEDLNHALEIDSDDTDIHMHLAAVYSLLEKKEKAYYHIDQAVSKGYGDTEAILTMEDLAYIRIQDDFESFRKNGFRLKKEKKNINEEDTLPADDPLLAQLKKLQDLRSKGLLSQREFKTEKEKLFRK